MNSVLVAPDSFKGTLTAAQVAAALADGLRAGGLEAVELPVADGGEGTAGALLRARGGELRYAPVHDPLGRSLDASFALLTDGSAVVEAAAASGLALIPPDARDPWAASTFGTGELIVAAVEAGAERVIVAPGGSATTDGGAGAVEAISAAALRPVIEVVCDVSTPWEQAARVFGPQKGADSDMVKRLEGRLAALARTAPRDPRGLPGTGCGGGLSGGLWAHLGARLAAGAPYVLSALGFDALVRESRFVVTGEGRLDPQTLAGKAVGEIATRCRQGGVACHAVVGQNALSDFEVRVLDLSSVQEAGGAGALRAAGRRLAQSTSS